MTGNGLSRQNKIRLYSTYSDFPTTGMTGVWYFDKSTNIPYVWDGSSYSLTLAEVNYIDFNLSYSATHQEGRLHWNSDDGTLEIGMPGGNVNLQIGQENLILASNKSGGDITNGEVVYISGAQGSRPTIELAKADSETTCSVIGVVTEDIDNNASGFVTINGLVRDIDTSSFTAGDTLYLSDSTAGAMTKTAPIFPSYSIKVGECIFSNNEEGIILVELLLEACNHVVINHLGINGSLKQGVTIVNAATYDLLTTDLLLHVTYTGTGAVTSLTLPTAQVEIGRVITIKDAGGSAGTNNITIDTEGAETIDGEDTYVINGNYDGITIYSDGSDWFIKNKK